VRNRLFNLLRARDIENAKRLLSQASYQDIAQALQELPPGERQLVLQLLDHETAVSVFELFDSATLSEAPGPPKQPALVPEGIQMLLAERQYETLRRLMADMNPVDVARFLEAMPPQEEVVAFRLLPKGVAIEVFEQMNGDEQQLLSGFTDERARDLIAGMSPDDRARLLDEVPAGVAHRLIQLLPPQKRETQPSRC
jgi:Mg/Co/Ni transporter MgtE